MGALAIPLFEGMVQVVVLLLSTLMMGVAGSFELTARNKYSALLVDRPGQLAPYMASFSVVFNVGKLVGPPLGGWLVALTGPIHRPGDRRGHLSGADCLGDLAPAAPPGNGAAQRRGRGSLV